LDACTIIAKNYLAHARVLARSFADHHPDGRFWTLIIDDFDGYVDAANEPFEVLTPAEIGCEPFIHMAMRYSVLELSTAVKPWLLRHLMGQTGRPVTYLDPDIKIYGSLKTLDDQAAAHGVVLIPHNSEPIPPDDRMPSQVDIMIAGIYNLGYVSLAPGREVEDLLDWWADRLERDCRVDPKWGYFVDQRWFDLTPGFLSDVAIVREPEFNLAYWNVHSRRLGWADGRYTVNDRPLAFFHFSGFDPEHPLVLSRHQNRVDVTSDPVLERLLGEYAGDVMGEGHAVSRGWPYSYGSLGDGMRIDDTLRGLYDDFSDEHDGRVASPFTVEGAIGFERWLSQTAPGRPRGITRALAHVYDDRADLRGAYPDPNGADLEGLLGWARDFGAQEVPLLARVTVNGADPSSAPKDAPVAETHVAKPPVPLRVAPWGVNLVGYSRAQSGLGDPALALLEALDAAATDVLPIEAFAGEARGQAAFPVNLFCMDGDLVPDYVREVGQEFLAGRYSIGLLTWDAGPPPAPWRVSPALLDEWWAPSGHVAALLEPVATVPVHTIRLPVAPPPVTSRSRIDLGLPEDRFLFVASLDRSDAIDRANPTATIAAFRQAVAPGDGPRLLLHCGSETHDPRVRERLDQAAAGHPDIDLIRGDIDLSSLIALGDAYVSLHRAEAFGPRMAEAMWLGKPVIATGYSGNLDFMTDDNAYLVRHRLIEIGPGHEPYSAHGEWAEPDVEHAASLMRKLVDDPEAGQRLGSTAADQIRRTHSAAVAGELIDRRLEAIRSTGRARIPADAAQERPAALAALPLKIRQGPAAMAPGGRGGSMRTLARRLVLRGIRPYTVHQDRVNAQLLAALEELNAHIAEIRLEAIRERARLLGELRSQRRRSDRD
jgi:glycosyltransferase involved in cell wall biosynthesis